MIEVRGRGGAIRRIVLIVIMVADGHEIRNFALKLAYRVARSLPLGSYAAAVHNIADSDYSFDIQRRNVVDDPLRLGIKGLGIALCVILRVWQNDDGKVGIGGLCSACDREKKQCSSDEAKGAQMRNCA